ncbi:MAG TPA: ROK family protein, partial [Caulobacteraceae bacterium]
MIRIGIDFGGSKIEAAALDADNRLLARVRRPNPCAYEEALATVRELVEQIEAAWGAGTVGMGIPGSISPATGRARNANSVWLNGRSLPQDIERVLDRPVRMANDANCLALSETADGAAAGADVAFAVIIGSGCGASVTVGARPLEGRNGIAGEWGHTPLPWQQPDERPG